MSQGKVRPKNVQNAPHYAVNYGGDTKQVYGQTPGSHAAGQNGSSPLPTAAQPVWNAMPSYAPPSPQPMQPLQASSAMYGGYAGQPHMSMHAHSIPAMHGVRL